MSSRVLSTLGRGVMRTSSLRATLSRSAMTATASSLSSSTTSSSSSSSLISSRKMSAAAPTVLAQRSFSSSSANEQPAVTTWSEEENMLRETVAKFAKEQIAPKVRAMDEKGELDLALLRALFEQGLMGVEIPPEYGGNGMTFVQSCIVIEELAKVDPAISVIVDIQNTLINTSIMKYGSESVKKRFLPKLASNTLASFGLSEAGSGSDAFAMKTTAVKKGDKYVLNGTKMWISNAKEAGLFVIFANADPSKGYKGITAFIVEKGTKGLTVGKKEDKLGIRASSTCELIIEDLEVPAENILGEVGGGYKIAIGSLNEGRIGIGAQMLGLAEGAFESAMPYVHQRKQFGQPISNFQGMQFSFADAATQIEAARLMVFNAARLKQTGQPFIQEAAMAKLYASQVAEKVASKSIEWLGGLGFTKEMPNEKFYRDAKIGSIYEGTTNLQLQTIAKHISKNYQ